MYRWCRMWERGSSIHTPYNAEFERMFKGQTGGRGDLSIPMPPTPHLISPGAEGVASFICLHNCRPVCLFVWLMLVRSAALLLRRQRRHHKWLNPLPSFCLTLALTPARPGKEIHLNTRVLCKMEEHSYLFPIPRCSACFSMMVLTVI